MKANNLFQNQVRVTQEAEEAIRKPKVPKEKVLFFNKQLLKVKEVGKIDVPKACGFVILCRRPDNGTILQGTWQKVGRGKIGCKK